MPLMDRIKITDFLSLSTEDQLSLVQEIQLKRVSSLAASRLKPVRKQGRAKGGKNRTKKPKDPLAAAAAVLKKLSSAQIAAIKESYGIK